MSCKFISVEQSPHASFHRSYQYMHIHTFAIRVRGSSRLITRKFTSCTLPLGQPVRVISCQINHLWVQMYIKGELPVTACHPTPLPASPNQHRLIRNRQPKLRFPTESTKCFAVAVRRLENGGTTLLMKVRAHTGRMLRFQDPCSCLQWSACVAHTCL